MSTKDKPRPRTLRVSAGCNGVLTRCLSETTWFVECERCHERFVHEDGRWVKFTPPEKPR